MVATRFTRWQSFDYSATDAILTFFYLSPYNAVGVWRSCFFYTKSQNNQTATISHSLPLLDMWVVSQIMYRQGLVKKHNSFCQNDRFVLSQRHPCPSLLSLLKFVTNWRRQGIWKLLWKGILTLTVNAAFNLFPPTFSSHLMGLQMTFWFESSTQTLMFHYSA